MKEASVPDKRFPFGFLLIWFIFLMVIFAAAQFILPKQNQFSYVETAKSGLTYLWPLANFDGIHYLSIAKSGYGLYQEAFFPLYPLLIKKLTPIFWGEGFLAGMIISWASLIFALVIFYRLARMDLSENETRWSIIALLFFPTSLFLLGIYTESLFFLLILLCFYFAKSEKWLLAGLVGALAAATRLQGVFLLPAVFMEWQARGNFDKKNWKKSLISLLPIFVIPLGLFLYMRFLFLRGDALAFIHVQPYFGARREVGRVILLHQVFWRYLKMLITVEKFTPTYFVVVLEFLTGLASLGLIVLAMIKKWFSYAAFMALNYIVPSFTGTFSSLPRYFIVFFPAFFVLGSLLEKHRKARAIYLCLCSPLFIIAFILFVRGYWVA